MPTRFDSVEWLATDNQRQYFGTNDDIFSYFDGTVFITRSDTADLVWQLGSDADGLDILFFGTTTTRDMRWDNSRDMLHFRDNAAIGIGGAASAAGDMQLAWDGTRLVVTPAAEDNVWRFGAEDTVMDVEFIGDTTGNTVTWDPDASAGTLLFPANTSAAAMPRLQIVDNSAGNAAPTDGVQSGGELFVFRNSTGMGLGCFGDATSVSGVIFNITP